MSLVVVDGTDGSGKSTQMQLLREWLIQDNKPFRQLNFPRYDKPSGALAKQYLAGEFGSKPEDVNPYAASTFYAVDRIASYLEEWRTDYTKNTLILTDRYTTANAVHQASKLPASERQGFFEWLFTFEYTYLGLPSPDLVLYLDMPAPLSMTLLDKRSGHRDIHETDLAYLESCRQTALQAAELYGWHCISCVNEDGALRSVSDIHQDVVARMTQLLQRISLQ